MTDRAGIEERCHDFASPRGTYRPGQLVWHYGTKQTGLITALKPYPDGTTDLLVRYVDTEGTFPEHWLVGKPGDLTWWGSWHLGGRGPFNRGRWRPQRHIDEVERSMAEYRQREESALQEPVSSG